MKLTLPCPHCHTDIPIPTTPPTTHPDNPSTTTVHFDTTPFTAGTQPPRPQEP